HGPQVASINGAILDKWLEIGGPNSDLGFPIADEAKTTDPIGRFSIFQNGSIYWHPNTGAHSITEPVLSEWAASGYELGEFGYPVAEAQEDGDFSTQSFQNGHIDAAKLNPLMAAITTPYIHFDSPALAEEFFNRVEQGLEQLSSSEELWSQAENHVTAMTVQAAAKRYGPCELEAENPHARKSGNFNTVGFKPVTRCQGPVISVRHKSDLRYKWYQWWHKAPSINGVSDFNPEMRSGSQVPAKHRNRGFTHDYTTKILSQSCEGKVKTLFIGVTEGTIVTNTGTYYARSYSRPTSAECEVP
ncbi:MAG: hypothetical protein Q4G50_12010, partial [Corynebacterium sp.]|uniref:LGFP repeat-containing protein n=1 Tax=Corynebacterium sp. TaxID=1720 RepID=UPI0026F74AE0|nr:hypothetical protein [Corynebacterium sp.]